MAEEAKEPEFPVTGDLLTLKQVSRRLGLSAKTVQRLVHSEGFPLRKVAIPPKGLLIVFWTEVEEWIRRQALRYPYRAEAGGQASDEIAALGEPTLRLAWEDCRQPIIYIWTRGDEVLYVGQSSKGLERPLGPHQALCGFQRGDSLAIWNLPEATGATLARLEAEAILRLRPRFNVDGKSPDTRRRRLFARSLSIPQ